jgi:hypothetical protein
MSRPAGKPGTSHQRMRPVVKAEPEAVSSTQPTSKSIPLSHGLRRSYTPAFVLASISLPASARRARLVVSGTPIAVHWRCTRRISSSPGHASSHTYGHHVTLEHLPFWSARDRAARSLASCSRRRRGLSPAGLPHGKDLGPYNPDASPVRQFRFPRNAVASCVSRPRISLMGPPFSCARRCLR